MDGGIALERSVEEEQGDRQAHGRTEAALRERERNQAFLLDWSDRIRGEASPKAIMAITLEALGRHLDVSRAIWSESDATGGAFSIRGEWRDGAPSLAGTDFALGHVGAMSEGGGLAEDVVRYDDIASDQRIDPAVAQSCRDAEVAAFVSVPLIEKRRVRAAISAQHNVPRAWTDSEVQLIRDIAERTWVSLERARAEAALQERERHQSFLIAWGDRIRPENEIDAIITITLEMLGRHLGVTRTTYAEADMSGRSFSILGEWRHGVSSIRGNSYSLRSVGAAVDRVWLPGEVIRYDDVANDPRLDPAAAERYVSRDILAFVTIPLVQDDKLHSALSVHHKHARCWTEAELQVMRDITERTWVALQRARAQAALQDRERNQAFLIAWNDCVRDETDARKILGHTLARLGEHLAASRTNYAEAIHGGDTLCVLQEWRNGVASVVGSEIRLAWVGSRLAAAHRSGRPIRINDIADDPLVYDGNRAVFESVEAAAMLTVPMMRAGEIVGVLSVHQSMPRRWSDSEVDLVCELADRTLAVLERAHSEERLAESEAQLAAFLENAPIAMHIKDAEGRYIRLNPEFARAMGLSVEAMIGRRPAELFEPEVAAQVEILEHRARAGEVVTSEIDDGYESKYASVLTMSFPIAGGKGVTAGFTIDLTDRKRAEAALARSREALYQTEKLTALGSLLAGVSHELNNPLSIVVAQAVMMERQSRGGELAERAQKIRKAADRCARIVQTFLAMARQNRPERAAVDLNAVAMAAHELADYGLRTDGIATVRELAPSLPPVSADSDQVHQIIINLIVNAQQAMVEANVPNRALTLRSGPGAEPGTVMLEISDNGPGIPEHVRRRIFEPFFTTKPQGQGTGVGLSFSQGLAEAHGGRLELVPSPLGACFRLTLPVDMDHPEADTADDFALPMPVVQRRALVIDDEAEIAESLADFLVIEGFDCDMAIGGEAAMAKLAPGLKASDYDLIISDLRMPGIDGPQLYAWIKAERPDLADRVAFATGDTLGMAAARFLGEAKRPVLEKPFTPEALSRFLQEMDRP
ncbi:MAG: GAF domain-containing protein [Sphingomonas sp.]